MDVGSEDLISLCVPSYNRPDTLERLLRSFLWQEGCRAELVITDDSTTDEVQAMVGRYSETSIVYVRNEEPLGYCANLKAALLKARGAVRVILGDDDFLVNRHALKYYQSLFEADPGLAFAYTNRLQVTRKGEPDVVHRFFTVDERFEPGEEAWANIWHRADCIAGLAIRASSSFIEQAIPEVSILYPQSLLVGLLLREGAAVGISRFLVAVSADETLLGYAVGRGDHIYGEERHGSMEYLEMVPLVIADPSIARRVDVRLGRELAYSLAVTLPDEKAYCGTRVALRNGMNLLRKSRSARRHPLLLLSIGATAILPSGLLQDAKRVVKQIRNFQDSAIWNEYRLASAAISLIDPSGL